MKKTYTLYSPIPSKKNSKRIVKNRRTGVSFILSSKNHSDWHKETCTVLAEQGLVMFDYPVRIVCSFTVGNKRKFDLSNKFESIADLLVDTGVLHDDNYEWVPQVCIRYNGYSKDNWETTIDIESLHDTISES